MPGHWKHDYIPLDYPAAQSKFHGHVPRGWLETYSSTRKDRAQVTKALVSLGAARHDKSHSIAGKRTHTELFARDVAGHRKMANDNVISHHLAGMRAALNTGDMHSFEGHRSAAKSRVLEHAMMPAGDIKDRGHGDMGARRAHAYGEHVAGWMRRTAHTAEASTTHKPLGKPTGPGLWHHKGLQLPPYIQHVAHHLLSQGHSESEAIQIAVGVVKNWAEGHDGHGNKVHPDVQAAAAKNIAQWEALKARH